MPTNKGYDSTGDQSHTKLGSPPLTSSSISIIDADQRLGQDEGTLLAVNSGETYFSDEKIHIPDVESVIYSINIEVKINLAYRTQHNFLDFSGKLQFS